MKNKGSIFALALLGAFAVGGTSMIAFQSHAQVASPPVAPVAIGQSSQSAEPVSKADTDNINDQSGDQSGPDKPDATAEVGADKETNDGNATSTATVGEQRDGHENDSVANPNEVEDGN
ncbi:MAG: hypothetical protein KGI69_00650 [Patescibacteria group bacterium]|nr:hypothetical protein [Patescibacteria group bacterium]